MEFNIKISPPMVRRKGVDLVSLVITKGAVLNKIIEANHPTRMAPSMSREKGDIILFKSSVIGLIGEICPFGAFR